MVCVIAASSPVPAFANTLGLVVPSVPNRFREWWRLPVSPRLDSCPGKGEYRYQNQDVKQPVHDLLQGTWQNAKIRDWLLS